MREMMTGGASAPPASLDAERIWVDEAPQYQMDPQYARAISSMVREIDASVLRGAYLWPHPLALASRVASTEGVYTNRYDCDQLLPVQPSRQEPMPDQPSTFEARMKIPEEMFSMMNNKSIVTREDVEKSFPESRMPGEMAISKLINGFSTNQESQISRDLSTLHPIEDDRPECIYAIVKADRFSGHWSPYRITADDNAVILRYTEAGSYWLIDNVFDEGRANGTLVSIAAGIIGVDVLELYDESYARHGCERNGGAWIEPRCPGRDRRVAQDVQMKLAIRDLMRRCLCIFSADYESSQSSASIAPGSLPREVYFL